jgi:hypothetical protein
MGKHGTWAMAFKIEITPRHDPAGATAYAVVVTIHDHETVVSFESIEAAERFAETERTRLTTDEQRLEAPRRGECGVRRQGIAADAIGASNDD